MAKKYIPAEFVRTTKTTNPLSNTDFDLEAYIVGVIEENGDAAIYPLEGAFVVDAASADITSATDLDMEATTDITLTAGTTIILNPTTTLDVNATTAVTIDSGTTTTITGGTGLTLDVTTGDMGLNSTDGDVIVSPAVNFTATASTGDVTIAATAGDVLINAGDDIILTPTANLTFTLAAIPTYADDTAAGVGGLTAGQIYKTAAGVLCIKL